MINTAAPEPATTAASSVASCPVGWGSLPKAGSSTILRTIGQLRAGQHDCYDRLVIDLDGAPVRYSVKYVSQFVNPNSGLPVALAGDGDIMITLYAAPAGFPWVNRPPITPSTYAGWKTFRDVKWASTFEGVTTIGLGVRARLPMRVFTLTNTDGGARLVIDVAHHW